MANYITVDGGTTNTRISLVEDNEIKDTMKFNVGARSGIENRNFLRETLRDGIHKLLEKNNMVEKDICRVLASGMITSEFGLYKLDHIKAPAGIAELNASMEEVVFEDITEIPFVFIRGIKVASDDFDKVDMMRGEETEFSGLYSGDGGAYVLPGSHSKVIFADSEGRITSFHTMLTGEMMAALSQNTILKDAVDLSCSELSEEYLLKGYHYCVECGINKALFKVRILKNIFGKNADETYSFFVGTILCGEIGEILKMNPEKIVIGGKKQIKQAMERILKAVSDADVLCIDDELVDECVSKGAIRIFEYR